MTAITVADLINAKTDVDHIDEVANSLNPTATDRLGHVKSTVAGAVAAIAAFNNRNAWAGPGTAYALKDVVLQSGTWYVCVVAHTSSTAFASDTANWRVFQGVLDADLRLADYASLRAYSGSATQVFITGYLVSATPSGIAGSFTRDDSDTTSVDNGGTIIIDANGRRWKRVYNGQGNVAWFGASSGMTASQSSAFQSAIDAVYAAGGDDLVVPAGTWRLDAQVVVKTGVRLHVDHKATIVHGANASLFRMKPRSRFEGGTVDVSGTSLASFNSSVFEFDGTDSGPSFRGVNPTVVRTEVVGRRGAGTGTAFYLHTTGASGGVYGVQIDAAVDGMEIGAYLVNDDPGTNTRWVNGNSIKLRGIGTVNFIKQVTGTDGSNVDGNTFEFDYQTDAANTSTVIQVKGRYNNIRGMLWDYAQVPAAVTFSAGAVRNAMSIHGAQTTQITDSGGGNTVFTYTDGNPALKVSQFAANSAGTLPITGMDVVMSNNKTLYFKDSGGTSRAMVALTSANNMQFGSSSIANALYSASVKHAFLVGAVEKLRVDGSANANDTALLLWDVTAGALVRVTRGAADSGGTGFRALRIPN